MRNGFLTLALLSLSAASQAAIDLRANEQPLPVTRDEQAVAKIPRITPSSNRVL